MHETAIKEVAGELLYPTYHDWELLDNGELRSFENCALNRKGYGEFLINYLNGEGEKGYVLNLNGDWGSGKTEFVRRLYAKLRADNHPVVFIDAWTSDFAKDPLMVVGCELLEQMVHCTSGYNNPEDLEKIKDFWINSWNKTVNAISSLRKAASLAAGGADEVLLGEEVFNAVKDKLTLDECSKVADGFVGQYRQQKNSIKEVRDYLNKLVSAFSKYKFCETPLYVIVDELDRCRPDYAIQLLETIKHFFAVPGVVFVVSTNVEQLQHSVRSAYGVDFDAQVYLRRFFDRKVHLPNLSVMDYLKYKSHTFSFLDNSNVAHDLKDNWTGGSHGYLLRYIELVADAYSLKLRDIEQLLARFRACMSQIEARSESGKQAITTLGLLSALAEFDTYPERFKNHSLNGKHQVEFAVKNNVLFEGMGKEVLLAAHNAMFLVERSIEGGLRGQTSKWVIDWTRVAFDGSNPLDYSNHTEVFRAFVNEARQLQQNQNDNYWMWDEISQLVEMAGVIE
ncbi:P-loop NTPase fold protein [Ferrimonas sp. SCSIO 43195]|uniref:KAP family P-loop NTPase fold protein n=1 Tax=Ferrimonas sp. SCSIO 43195 TaxID=2822844 RepID=UPI00207611FE|nr:P-loop NTPase fold protein [Ferrimonas sp. SCSIO 43195]USD36100.1 hypothetical protein J8Z22_13760 [Ferrimonas sp. SCSIO 43195]